MCFPFSFASQKPKRNKSSPPRDKKRRDTLPSESLRGDGRRVVVEASEKRPPADWSRPRKSVDSPYQEWEDYMRRQQSHRPRGNAQRSRVHYATPLHVDIPDVWHRSVAHDNADSSDEMLRPLLNPRPHRSPHHRQKHASQKTLRGHGKRVTSKKSSQDKSGSGWRNPFAPSSPEKAKKTRRGDSHHYQHMESPPRTHRSHRQQTSSQYDNVPESSRSHQRRSRPRRHAPSGRQTTPNTSARRDPDRRFAVLAATNNALEDLRREAFQQPSPPPHRERLRRFQGVTIPASSIPYSWDCVSSTTSNGYGEPSSRSPRGR
ncbi:unnamed protein product [Periconia digitata]|uniref:Uncharacterized protein n=1 Tax=Periconia digitata TaxID=1303443 RepID=A0A9W4XPB6_9PLEO|nr:unnamed protein product [Periconia digitata]